MPRAPGGDPRREALAPGAGIGAWIVDALHAQGGFAAVYRAHHAESGRRAALKVLLPELAASPEALVRLRREAQALLRLRHPHIVEMLDVVEMPGGAPALVMEWLDGRDLAAELAARGALTPSETLAVMEELCSALAATHERGLVHRDVKAQNVIAQPHGDWFTVKLIDFGIAKATDDAFGPALTTSRQVIGTPLTMAPEQILGRAVDARTDVYALGVLLYQLLTGRLPFRGATAAETEELHLGAPPPRASELARVPAAVDAVIARCLAKAPDARFAGPAELIEALREAAAGEGEVSAAPARVTVALLGLGFPADASDAALADADAVAERFRAVCAAAGAPVTLELGDLLAAPVAGNAEALARVTRAVGALAAELAARPGAAVAARVLVAEVPADRDTDGTPAPRAEALAAVLAGAAAGDAPS